MRSLSALLVLLLVGAVSAISATGNRLLAILDDAADKAKYSQFLGDLGGRGFEITYDTPKSNSTSLFHLGERSYDHIVFFPLKGKALGPKLTANVILDFINAKGNILLALTSAQSTPSTIVNLLAELDMQLPADRQGVVVDHFNYDAASAADMHDVLLLPPPKPLRPDLRDFLTASARPDEVLAFPRGMGAVLGPSALLTPIVRAPPTAYLYNRKEQAETVDDLFAAGAQLALATAFQARTGARLAVVGAGEMLEDKWFDAPVKTVAGKDAKTFNREFTKRVSGWAFQEVGVLRVNWIEHHLNEVGASNASNPKIYRIKNDVTYSVSISEWSWNSWSAFHVPANDVLQLEFSMLSPFHRLPLALDTKRSTKTENVYTVSFKLPDQHGIFNFMLNYKRPFLTSLVEKNTVSVRHMAHDEWPRSYVISGAWPWIFGIAATVIGWVAFCAVWMYSAPVGNKETKKRQ